MASPQYYPSEELCAAVTERFMHRPAIVASAQARDSDRLEFELDRERIDRLPLGLIERLLLRMRDHPGHDRQRLIDFALAEVRDFRQGRRVYVRMTHIRHVDLAFLESCESTFKLSESFIKALATDDFQGIRHHVIKRLQSSINFRGILDLLKLLRWLDPMAEELDEAITKVMRAKHARMMIQEMIAERAAFQRAIA